MSSEVARHLRRAKELINVRDHERALEELCRAEAVARGDVEALGEISRLRSLSSQSVGHANLAEAVQDALRGLVSALLSGLPVAFAGAVGGGIIGVIVGFATEPPPDPNALLDDRTLHVIGYGILGALLGAALAVILLALSALRARIQRRRVQGLRFRP